MKKIPLTLGLYALVDDEDYESLFKHSWWASAQRDGVRAKGFIDGKNQYMHRVIMGVTDPSILVDHADHNTLNNQKINLRKCSPSQNMANRAKQRNTTSRYIGVHWWTKGKRWRASAMYHGKVYYLGVFKSEIEAARAYDEFAIKAHGDFATLNIATAIGGQE